MASSSLIASSTSQAQLLSNASQSVPTVEPIEAVWNGRQVGVAAPEVGLCLNFFALLDTAIVPNLPTDICALIGGYSLENIIDSIRRDPTQLTPSVAKMLRDALQANSPFFTPRVIAKTAEALKGCPDEYSDLTDELRKVLQAHEKELLANNAEKLKLCQVDALVDMTEAAAKLAVLSASLMNAMDVYLKPKLSQCTKEQLITLSTSTVKRARSYPDFYRTIEAQLLCEKNNRLSECSIAELLVLMRAFSFAKENHKKLFLAIIRELLKNDAAKLKASIPKEIAGICRILSAMQIDAKCLFDAIENELVSPNQATRIKELDSNDVVSIVFSYVQLGVGSAKFVTGIASELSGRDVTKLSNASICELLWVLVVVGQGAEPLFTNLLSELNNRYQSGNTASLTFDDFALLAQVEQFFLHTPAVKSIQIKWQQQIALEMQQYKNEYAVEVKKHSQFAQDVFQDIYQILEHFDSPECIDGICVDAIIFGDQVDEKAIVEVVDSSQFMLTSHTPKRAISFKHQLLELMGYKVFVVDYWKMKEWKGAGGRVGYLQNLLGEFVR
jgi:hypothetical protein